MVIVDTAPEMMPPQYTLNLDSDTGIQVADQVPPPEGEPLPESLRPVWFDTEGGKEIELRGVPGTIRLSVPEKYGESKEYRQDMVKRGVPGDPKDKGFPHAYGRNLLLVREQRRGDETDPINRATYEGINLAVQDIPPHLLMSGRNGQGVKIEVIEPEHFPYWKSLSPGISRYGDIKLQLIFPPADHRDGDRLSIEVMEDRRRTARRGLLSLFAESNPDLVAEWVRLGGNRSGEDSSSLAHAIADTLEDIEPRGLTITEGRDYADVVSLTEGQKTLLERLLSGYNGRFFETMPDGSSIIWIKGLD